MAARVKAIEGAGPCLLGEGAIFQSDGSILWWVDIRGSRLFRYTIETGALQAWPTPEWITRVVPTEVPGCLVGTLASSFGRIDTRLSSLKIECDIALDDPELRFNDGAMDPTGAYWAGTMPLSEDKPRGYWLRFAKGKRPIRLQTPGFTVTNGPAFDATEQHVYLTDSATRQIYRARFEPETGLQNLRPWRSFSCGDGYPDGMVIGPDGLLWIAFWDGGCLRALDGQGDIKREIELPVKRPTSLAFKSKSELFVTSASYGLQPDGMQGRTLKVQLSD